MGGEQAVADHVVADGLTRPAPGRLHRLLHFWRSPEGQPPWARPALLAVAALAALSYGWAMANAQLEPFYGSAARSMAENWHNFIFGAVDPWGTVSVDKLPGALWFQALSLRVFGFHVWALVLPQVVEGTLTILVLFRAVRRVAGAGAGLIAALVMASSPIVILLDHGNISDTLLILFLVLAADATMRGVLENRPRSLLLAGLWVGLAFQTKMLQAWLILPALYATYLLAAPIASRARRLWHIALSAVVVLVVSLSWMTAVSIVPAQDRPYVDGSCNNSLFDQVFLYNGLHRLAPALDRSSGCHTLTPYLVAQGRFAAKVGINTAGIAPAWDRLITGVFGHDDAWLLPATVIATIGIFLSRRRKPRTDPLRAVAVLWSLWLVLSFGFFSGGVYLNSYYVAELLPAIAVLCGIGMSLAWRHRADTRVRSALAASVVLTAAATYALIPAAVGLRPWIEGSTLAVGALAVLVLIGSLRSRHASVWATTVGPTLAAAAMLLGTSWASAIVVLEGLGPFNSPYEPAFLNQVTRNSVSQFNDSVGPLRDFVRSLPASVAADVIETSGNAGENILATGHEFLPVGGFSGEVPSPPLRQFIGFVAAGRVRRVTLSTSPLTHDPDLLWARAHCERLDSYPSGLGINMVVYQCRPADAKSS